MRRATNIDSGALRTCREQVVSALEGGGRDLLKKHDQARAEMIAGAIFHGLREGPLAFAPTYKFDKGVPGPGAYDSSEKRRVPAWTDRVFFKGALPAYTRFMALERSRTS